MPSKIHLICKQREGLQIIDKETAVYESRSWLLSQLEAEALKGGVVMLHETKAKESYFGGTVLEIRPDGDQSDGGARTRCVIVVGSTAACRGVPWDKRGKTHGMAWTSGVLPVEG